VHGAKPVQDGADTEIESGQEDDQIGLQNDQDDHGDLCGGTDGGKTICHRGLAVTKTCQAIKMKKYRLSLHHLLDSVYYLDGAESGTTKSTLYWDAVLQVAPSGIDQCHVRCARC
jgi:hypothetical protein